MPVSCPQIYISKQKDKAQIGALSFRFKEAAFEMPKPFYIPAVAHVPFSLRKRQISQCLAQEKGMRENTIESNKVPCTLE